MRIANARVALSPTRSGRRDIEIRNGRIHFRRAAASARPIDLTGYLMLPGLVNAHDHLEFNLFPRLGRRIYANATEWANDIYRPAESPVREHLALPKRDRLIWGGLRNLLSGVTTVAHHNPYHPGVFGHGFPVRVVKKFGWAHSLAFAPDLAERYRATPRHQPFILHACEGTDERARAEIAELDRMNILGSRTVLVHAIALDRKALRTVQRRGCSMVWCPSSNLLTYGETLRANAAAALGTDSAISAAGDMIDELRIAHARCGAAPESLYRLVTVGAARALRVRGGVVAEGSPADLVAVIDRGQSPAEALLDFVPELVIVAGRVHLVSEALCSSFEARATRGFHSISLEGRGTWRTPFDIPGLLERARAALGPEIRLAGKLVQ